MSHDRNRIVTEWSYSVHVDETSVSVCRAGFDDLFDSDWRLSMRKLGSGRVMIRRRNQYLNCASLILCIVMACGLEAWALDHPGEELGRPASTGTHEGVAPEDVRELRALLLEQRKAIDELKEAVRLQQVLIDQLRSSDLKDATEVRETSEKIPAVLGPVSVAKSQSLVTTKTQTEVSNALSVAGFRLTGDFRFRLDIQSRSGNSVAGPLQNIRSRYRMRLNLDKELDPRFNFHLQLSTGPTNNGITNDQDFAGMPVKHPLGIAESYIDYHPHSNFSIRGGRMEEVFADNSRFLWDDDARFNGFQQILNLPVGSSHSIELRAGEYWLSNPNISVLAANSPYISSGYSPGSKVHDANLFHPGVVLNMRKGSVWKHQVISDFQLYRNQNQIQLASTGNGFPVLLNGAIGLALAGPIGGTGDATTTPGGAIFTAPKFNVLRTSYRVDHRGVNFAGHEMPVWFSFQVSRNTGATFLQDALMGTANIGAVKKPGDVRLLYQFAIKDANSMVSQFTDDDLGTGSGVNIAVHAIRFDIGLTRFLQWQNLLFFQHERRGSNPDQLFFVPLGRGSNMTLRYLGQLAFNF